jgi:hypothetical protein
MLEKIVKYIEAADARAVEVTGYILTFFTTLGEKADRFTEQKISEE